MKYIIILTFLIPLTSWAQNKKPITLADSFDNTNVLPIGSKPRPWNVLWNDKDPNGDKMTVTRFNGKAFTGEDSVLIDGGIFYMTSTGNFMYKPTTGFKGTLVLTYHVNDGKSGPPTQGQILFIRQ